MVVSSIPRDSYGHKGGIPCNLKTTLFDSLMIVLVKDRNQWGCSCVRPRGRYWPKGWIPCNFLNDSVWFIGGHFGKIWRKQRTWLFQKKIQLHPQRGIPWIFLTTLFNILIIILVIDEYQWVHGCVIPKESYFPKEEYPENCKFDDGWLFSYFLYIFL